MIFSKAFLPLAAAMALIGASSVAAVSHGLAWPGETSGGALANSAASGSIRWYFHYDQGGVPGFENIEWVPTYYAPRLYDQWQAVKNVINGGYRPNTIMAFNEPDNQNPISPSDAAAQWNQELRPYQQQGIRISSPQIAYDLGWLSSFMSILQNQYGASPDVIAIHFYGSADDNGLNGLRNYVGQVQSQYPGKAIFVSELGVQAANVSSLEFLRRLLFLPLHVQLRSRLLLRAHGRTPPRTRSSTGTSRPLATSTASVLSVSHGSVPSPRTPTPLPTCPTTMLSSPTATVAKAASATTTSTARRSRPQLAHVPP